MRHNALRLTVAFMALLPFAEAVGQAIPASALTAPAGDQEPSQSGSDLNLFGPPPTQDKAAVGNKPQRASAAAPRARESTTSGAGSATDLPPPIPQTATQDVTVRDKNWDSPKPAPHQYAPGAARYPYHEGITVHVRQGQPCLLIFPPWINIIKPVSGMPGWAEVDRVNQNVVSLKATKADKDLGLQIITNDGIFSFNLRTYSYSSAPFVTDAKVDIDLPQELNPATSSAPVAATGAFVPADSQQVSAPSKYYSMLPTYARRHILDASRVTIPHQPEEHAEGDWAAIGPMRIWEDSYRTYFDFGPEYRLKPRPQFYRLVDGVERPVTPLVLDQGNGLVAIYSIGDFVLRYDQRIICVMRTDDPEAGIKSSATRPAK